MQTLGRAIELASSMTGKTEAGFRLLKACETYFDWGYRLAGLQSLKNAEQLFKTVTAFQNLYRVVKALNFYREMDKVKHREWDNGGVKLDPALHEKWLWELSAEERKKVLVGRAHKVFAILSPTTLLVVSLAGFTKFLGERQVLPMSTAWGRRLETFGRIGGGYFGNCVAATSGALGSWNLYRAADYERKEGNTAEAEKRRIKGGSHAWGSLKYGLDFGATVLEEYYDRGGFFMSCFKALSRHTALVQSACEPLKTDLWTSALKRVWPG